MSHTIPTMRVKADSPDNEQGFYLINREDFDPDQHEPFDEIEPGSPEAEALAKRLTQELENSGEDNSNTSAPNKPNKKK